MATLQQIIAEGFLAKLSESKHINSEQINQLRTLLSDNKKPKADDFTKIFALSSGDVK